MEGSGGRVPLCIRSSSSNSSAAFHGIAGVATSQKFSGDGFLEVAFIPVITSLQTSPVSSWPLPLLGGKG